jgi:hypothetical protein
MAKNYQLVHRLGSNRQQSTHLFAAVSVSNHAEQYMIKITNLEDLNDSFTFNVNK